MSSVPRRRLALLAGLLLLPLLAACSSTVPLSPAPLSNSVGCANVTVRLPETVDSTLRMRSTNAQATAAWGSPVAVILHCGITTPQVSDLACYTIDGVDWLADTKGSTAIYTTYGRVPGVEVVASGAASSNVLFDLSPAMKTLKKTAACESVSAAPSAKPTP